MLKKLTLLLIAMWFSSICLAETCPTIAAIRHHALKGWVAYDSEDGTTLPPKRAAQFRRLVKRFALAEWSTQRNKDGSIHCYYIDKAGSNLEAYLSKDHFVPVINKNYWYQVSGYTQCAAGKDQCKFRKRILSQQQLARR